MESVVWLARLLRTWVSFRHGKRFCSTFTNNDIRLQVIFRYLYDLVMKLIY